MKKSRSVYIMGIMLLILILYAINSFKFSFREASYTTNFASFNQKNDKNVDSLPHDNNHVKEINENSKKNIKSSRIPVPNSHSKVYAANIDFYIPALFIIAIIIIVYISKNKNFSKRK